MSQVEKHTFQAEIQQLLSIVIHSLYTNREVFVRELISNAADACEKWRFLQASGQLPAVEGASGPTITLTSDEATGVMTITDTGVGMTRDELVQNLGTIAHSGTKAFLKALAEKQQSADGKLITESLRDYTRINLAKQYDSLDKFLQAWNDADRKAALVEELEKQGVLIEALAEEVANTGLIDLDPFDLLLHVAYNMPPLTRRERANRVKKRNAFTQYGPVARKVIDALIDKYADEGIATIESNEVLKVQPFTDFGSPVELIKSFGGRMQYLGALQTLERELYAAHP